MRVLLIILAVLAVLLILLLVLPVGIDCSYLEGKAELKLKFGPFRFQTAHVKKAVSLLMGGKKPKKKEEAEKEAEEKPAASGRNISFSDILELLRIGLDGVNRFFKRLDVDCIMFHFVSGAPDPADAAILYGKMNAALEALIPLIRRAVRSRRTDVKTGLDFDLQAPVWEARLIISIHLWEFIFIAPPVIRGLLRWLRRHRQGAQASSAAAPQEA